MTPDLPNDPDARAADAPDVSAVDPLDERLSAALDGADTPDGPAVGGAAPAAEAQRLQALAAARDLLAVPPLPLDDMTRRRLLRAALEESRAPVRSNRRWSGGLGVAAAILAVVVIASAVFASLNHDSNPRYSAASAPADQSTNVPKASEHAGGSRNLHEVSDPTVLLRRVEAALGTPSSPFATKEASPAPTTGNSDAAAGADAAHCVAGVPAPAGSTRAFLANATYHGIPAVVVVVRDGARTLIYVLATADCRPLTTQFLRQ